VGHCHDGNEWRFTPAGAAAVRIACKEIRMGQIQSITSAINGYFDLMYEADDNRFLTVFHGSSLVHGVREGKLIAWSASEFRDVIRSRPSPAAMKSPREQEILSIECTAPDLAAAKVRVRVGQTRYIDHLIFHHIDGKWLITSKAFYVAKVFPSGS
jgi:Putative lumazine-binding